MVLGTGQNTTHMVLALPDESKIFTANIAGRTASRIIEARRASATGTRRSCRWAKGRRASTSRPTGSRSGRPIRATAVFRLSTLRRSRWSDTFNVRTKRSNRLKFTPDGRLVLISDLDAGELVVLERATRKDVKRIKLGRQLAGILITPDSSRAYCAVTGDDNVAVIDLKTLELVDRLKTGVGPDGMAWIK